MGAFPQQELRVAGANDFTRRAPRLLLCWCLMYYSLWQYLPFMAVKGAAFHCDSSRLNSSASSSSFRAAWKALPLCRYFLPTMKVTLNEVRLLWNNLWTLTVICLTLCRSQNTNTADSSNAGFPFQFTAFVFFWTVLVFHDRKSKQDHFNWWLFHSAVGKCLTQQIECIELIKLALISTHFNWADKWG